MTTLSHGGVPVTMTPAGSFQATIAGTVLTAPSFASLKKKIEKAGAFEPFEAFHMDQSWRDSVQPVSVIGIRNAGKGRNDYNVKRVYVVREGQNTETRSGVYRSTPENLAIAAELLAEKKRNHAAYDEGKKRERAIESRLVRSSADKDFEAALAAPVAAEGSTNG